MSAKWRALQQRHKYTYNSVVFPKHFLESLNDLAVPSSFAFDFFAHLKHFVSLTSTYAQVAAAKDLAAAFAQLIAKPLEGVAVENDVTTAVRLYLEILFLENSLPLHRTLISAIAKSRSSLSLIGSCFEALCEENSCDLGRKKKGKKRFLVSRAALSLISFPKLGFLNETLEKCSNVVMMDVVSGLGSVVSDIEEGSRPSPVVMEQCQEAMSCLYYLLQRFPVRFVSSNEVSDTFQHATDTVLSVLKSSAFSRDCLVAAGVSFCAAVQAYMSPEEISSFISRRLFGFSSQDGNTGHLEGKTKPCFSDLSTSIGEIAVLSRLCLLRGILTTIPRNVLNMLLIELSSGSLWTILYNGILPELCNYCENSIDSHFNFHALTVTQICLQQVKASITTGLTDFSGDYNPFPDNMMNRILKIIWNNLEDPLNQTVKQVHLIFDLLLDIRSSLPPIGDHRRNKPFLFKVAGDLLLLGPRCKGRYVPLAALSKRLGAKTLLNLNDNLLFETAYAYVDDDVCCAATSFLKCFLECLRDECWSSSGVEKGYDVFRETCLPPFLHGLVSGHSKLRSNLNTYALPLILEVDTDSLFSMLEFISIGPKIKENTNIDFKIDQRVAALVSVLKVSRALALIEGDIDLDQETLEDKLSDRMALVRIKGIDIRVPVEWIVLALKHADDSLRIDAAESLFLNPKTSSLPSSLELSLIKVAVPFNMRCSSTSFQMKWISLFRKFFTRVQTALERQIKQGLWKPLACLDSIENVVVCKAQDLFQCMKWLSCYLFNSCYPSAPYERKTMAMELILVMLDVWPVTSAEGDSYLHPYSKDIISPDATLALVGSIIDSWDRLRQSSFRILLCFPTPLPGISSNNSLNDLIAWAKKLVCSPRVRESDAGALTLRLIFKKYVLQLGWVFEAPGGNSCLSSQSDLIKGDVGICKPINPVVEYISSLIEWLGALVEEAEKDLSEACRKSFVHGVLLALRYTYEELDWSSDVVQSSISEIRALLEKLLDLIMQITSLALWVVSADAWSMPYDIEDMVEDSAIMTDISFEINQAEPAADSADQILTSKDSSSPADQVVMVSCWLAMKEVSLLLGTIIRKIPLPSCVPSDSSTHVDSVMNTDESEIPTEGVLDLVQLETIGNHFLQVLLKMKHNGAIDKTRAGFTALCNRLLCSNDPRLCKMTESWMEKVMERTTSKQQTVDDLLRRSAGIPAAFIALFLSEPEGTPKKLLPRALRWLIDVANKSLSRNSEDGGVNIEAISQDEPSMSKMADGLLANERASKIRDEGVVPTVHAFNVLRAAFDDTNLATDTSGFSAEAMIVSIRSFSSPYWEVRNSACLAYTALVRRMIGFLNVQRRESVRRALTGLEFFHRYPALHPFLFSELSIATEFLGDDCSREMGSDIAKAIHPSLCPILILLTRLKPSLVSSIADDALDPFLFLPFLRKCATQSNLRLRVLASRALTGLVSNEKLHTVITEVASCLPHGQYQISMPKSPFMAHSMSANMCNGVRAKDTCATSFNSIHGLLLQLLSLLDNNCRGLSDIAKKDQILGELIQVLSRSSWIGRMKSCPCPTLNCSYLRVLDLMIGIAKRYSSKFTSLIQDLLLELASECLDADDPDEFTMHDPTLIELRRQAVVSFFTCLLAERNKDLDGIWLLRFNTPSRFPKVPEAKISVTEIHERMISLVSDPSYEVRVAMLKKLLQLVQSKISGEENGVIYTWAETYLHSLLVNRLPLEENPKCTYNILRIFYYWNLQIEKSSHADQDFFSHFWDKLVDLSSATMHSKTREISLCCMGICVKKFAKLQMSSLFTDECLKQDETNCRRTDQTITTKGFRNIESFISLVKHHSAPFEPVTMRRAAAEAIIASGLLVEAVSVASFVSNRNDQFEDQVFKIEEVISQFEISKIFDIYACRILDLWFTCIQLLEDEDIALREKLAKDVQISINSRLENRRFFSDDAPTQVDRVIASSFDFLSSIFGHWLEYLNYLSKWVFITASPAHPCGDLVRQVFDKEIDNHHEEKLLICQICCLHLEKLLLSKASEVGIESLVLGESSINKFPWNSRFRFLRQLTSLAHTYLETEGKTDWIGGIGNHKDAFTSVYANLLGLYALSHSLCEGYRLLGQLTDTYMLYLSEFVELGDIIRPFLKNPLISNLYDQLMQLHHKLLDAFQTRRHSPPDYLSCSGFEPYFLLR